MGSGQDTNPVRTVEDYMTVADAGQFLGRCTRTVMTYIGSGVLRATRFRGQGKKWWIRRDDLRALKSMGEKERLRTSDIWDLLYSIKMRLHSIDERVNFLMRVNGLDVSCLRDVEISILLGIYDEIEELVETGSNQIEYTKMEEWGRILLQFSEIEFQRLVAPTQNMKPWIPFHQLCLHLMSGLRRKKGFASHQGMQEAYRVLEKARKSLALAITIFNEGQAAHLGPQTVKKIAPYGLREDSLDRYISAELTPDPL
jgi:hypothetical protein